MLAGAFQKPGERALALRRLEESLGAAHTIEERWRVAEDAADGGPCG